MSRFLIGSMIFGLSLLTAAGAGATTSALPNANNQVITVTAGGWSVSFNQGNGLNACALNLGTTPSNNCSPEQVAASVDAAGNLTLTYTLAGGGSLLTSSGTIRDLALFETVTAPGNQNIYKATLSETGAGTLSMTVGETVHATSFTGTSIGSLNTSIATDNSTHTATSVTSFVAQQQHQVFVTKDIQITAGSGSATITTVTQTFSVPEPASLSLLAIGFGGLVGLRRRRAARG